MNSRNVDKSADRSSSGLDQPVASRIALTQHLAALKSAGVEFLPKGEGKFSLVEHDCQVETVVDEPPTAASTVQPTGDSVPAETPLEKPQTPELAVSESSSKTTYQQSVLSPDAYGPKLDASHRRREMQILNDAVSQCTRCDDLVSNRTQTVFGVGNLNPRLVFFGEGPGADEDRTGEPFVGAAGKLLNKIIAACRLEREEVYILNTVKCRPPGNRNPSNSEQENCWEFAERQFDILQPEFICCLGSVAARRLLNTTQSLGRLRRQFHQYRGSRVVVTYHPAYLLRTESAKKHVWEDMKMLMKEMGVDVTK